VLAIGAHDVLDLRGELARRRDDQARARAAVPGAGAMRRGRLGKALQQRQDEAGGLAGAGLGAGEDVAPASTRGMAWVWIGVGSL
jgi:hypothetical protein